jgi:rod shape-determining protein MreD
LTLFMAVVIQSTILPRLGLADARLDLVLVLVVIWSALRSSEEALLWGLLGGAFVDLFSIAPFGVATLTLGVTALLASALGEQLRRTNGFLVLLLPPLFTIIANLLMLFVFQSTGWPIDLPSSVALVILPGTLLNTLAGPFAYLFLRAAAGWLQPRMRIG